MRRPYLALALVILSGAVVVVATARQGALLAPAAQAPSTSSAPSSAPAAATATATASASAWPASNGDGDASCSIPDRGSGLYPADWTKLPVGRMLAPQPAPQGKYDVLLHLHGGEAARRVVAPLKSAALVLVAIDAGTGSRVYADVLAGPDPLQKILSAVGDAMKPAQLRHLIVSSWSAGYGGVREILNHHPTVPNALVLLDSVHASYDHDGKTIVTAGLEPFASYAARAIAGEALLILTHSEIRPPGYAATGEVASWLLRGVDGRRRYAGLLLSHGVEFKTRFDRGGMHVRGYTGKGKPAHCAQLMLLEEILRDDVLPQL